MLCARGDLGKVGFARQLLVNGDGLCLRAHDDLARPDPAREAELVGVRGIVLAEHVVRELGALELFAHECHRQGLVQHVLHPSPNLGSLVQTLGARCQGQELDLYQLLQRLHPRARRERVEASPCDIL